MSFGIFHYLFHKVLVSLKELYVQWLQVLERGRRNTGSIFKWNFSMQTPSSVWPLHLSNTRSDAAPPILSLILPKNSLINCLVLFPGVDHLRNKFGVDDFCQFQHNDRVKLSFRFLKNFKLFTNKFPCCVDRHWDRA